MQPAVSIRSPQPQVFKRKIPQADLKMISGDYLKKLQMSKDSSHYKDIMSSSSGQFELDRKQTEISDPASAYSPKVNRRYNVSVTKNTSKLFSKSK